VTTPRRILLIRPSALGDVFRSVPVAASIARAYPGVPLDWVVQTEFADAVRAHPAVDRVIPFPRRELVGFWKPIGGWRRTAAFLATLRNGYDLAIDAQGLARSGAMAIFSGARTRIGFADAREFGWIGLNRRIRVAPGLPAVDRMLAMLAGAGIEPVEDLRLFVPDDAEAGWSAWRRERLGDARYAAIAPTARWRSKQWPEARFAELARRLLDEGRIERVLLLGAPSESAVLDEIAHDRSDIVSIAGAGPLAMSMAAVRDAAIVIGNDSAMLHAAAGFDRPLVGLFGPTDPVECGPCGRIADTIRADGVGPEVHYRDRGLGDQLMRRIEVDPVVELAAARLDGSSGAVKETDS
jgi:lipopolysaccharide heptosyltransferase I